MGKFFADRATAEITLSNGGKVQVRRNLSAIEAARLKEKLVLTQFDAATGKLHQLDIDWPRAKMETLRSYVVSWDFADDEGNAVAYAPEMVGELHEAIVEEIATAIDQLQAQLQEQGEKKSS